MFLTVKSILSEGPLQPRLIINIGKNYQVKNSIVVEIVLKRQDVNVTLQGKHHTAVAKFKQAMEHTFQQLEALLNTCLQYQKLGNTEAEIQGLKLLKQVKH